MCMSVHNETDTAPDAGALPIKLLQLTPAFWGGIPYLKLDSKLNPNLVGVLVTDPRGTNSLTVLVTDPGGGGESMHPGSPDVLSVILPVECVSTGFPVG